MSEECEKSASGTYVPTGNAQDASNSTVFAMNEVNEELSKKKPRKDTWKGSYHYHKMLDVLNIDYPYETDSCYHENGNKMYEGQWKYGKRHGTGTSFWGNGKVLYSGQWQHGEEHGKGTLYDEKGTRRYEGQ